MSKKTSIKKEFEVEITKLKTNYELRYDYSPMITEYIKTLPKEHRGVKVESAIDPHSGKPKDVWVRLIREVAMGQIISFFLDNAIKFKFNNVLEEDINKLRQEYLDRQRRLAESLKLKAEKLVVSEEALPFMKIQPYNYQKKAVAFFEINNGKAILGDAPGVGKTLSALVYAAKHRYKTLIICPSSLKFGWKNETLDFTKDKAFIYKYKPKKNSPHRAFDKNESLFHIVNYESLETYVEIKYKHVCKGSVIVPGKGSTVCNHEITDNVKKHKECPVCKNSNSFKTRIVGHTFSKDKFGQDLNPADYDLIVIDEFHRIKEKNTGWTKIIREAFKDAPRKLLLSGTAIKSRPKEFFIGLNFLYPEEFNNQHEFGVKYCAGFQDNFGWKYDGASNLEELYDRMSRFFLRRLKKDVLKDLPPKTYTKIPIELDDSEYKEYNRILDECTKVIDGQEIKDSYLVQVNKLKMFTASCRLKRVIEYIQEIIDSGEKVVIMSDFQNVATKIFEHFKEVAVLHTGSMSDIEKQESVDRFQKDKNVKVFSGMIIASGVGITLTAASRLIFMGYAWTPADMTQSEDRIHRASTTHDNIQIITPYCIDTIDEDIMNLLSEKNKTVDRVLDGKVLDKNENVSSDSVFKSLIKKMSSKTGKNL
jgi:SWI/SNF-related matrix-associated actin-dependent regulator 1 of chromatin subfamily A